MGECNAANEQIGTHYENQNEVIMGGILEVFYLG